MPINPLLHFYASCQCDACNLKPVININKNLEIKSWKISSDPSLHSQQRNHALLLFRTLCFCLISFTSTWYIYIGKVIFEWDAYQIILICCYCLYLLFNIFITSVNIQHSGNISHRILLSLLQLSVSSSLMQILLIHCNVANAVLCVLINVEFFLSLYQFSYIAGSVINVLFDVIVFLTFADSFDSMILSYYVPIHVFTHVFITYASNIILLQRFMRYSGTVQDAMIGGSRLETNLSGTINPGSDEITVFFGSCIDQTYCGKIAVLERMANKNPDVMVFLGDNVYVDPDFCKCLYAEHDYSKQYNNLLAHQSFNKLLNATDTHFLGIWDDHDYYEDNADAIHPFKVESKTAFINGFLKKIQVRNDKSLLGDYYDSCLENDERGVYYYYDYKRNNIWIRFYLLDGRYHKTGNNDILGETQWEWLLDLLANNESKQSIDWHVFAVGTCVLLERINFVKRTAESFGMESTKRFVNSIEEAGIASKSIILSGDIHSAMYLRKNNLYEFISSSITHTWPAWASTFCFKKSKDYVYSDEISDVISGRNNFGCLKFSKRKWEFVLHDAYGYEYIPVSYALPEIVVSMSPRPRAPETTLENNVSASNENDTKNTDQKMELNAFDIPLSVITQNRSILSTDSEEDSEQNQKSVIASADKDTKAQNNTVIFNANDIIDTDSDEFEQENNIENMKDTKI